jgi:ParB/RepB/Spo0J family partition protein
LREKNIMAAETNVEGTKSKFRKAREQAAAEKGSKETLKQKADAELYTEIRLIPVADVIVAKGFNIEEKRHSEEEIQALADDIRHNGLLNPITVRAVLGKRRTPDALGNIYGDNYYLIAGEGRLRAIQKLGVANIQANVKRVGELEALVLNTTENVDRKAIHVWALGERLRMLSETHELSPQRLAAMFGLTAVYVRNLVRMVRDTAPSIAKDIREKMGSEQAAVLPKYKWLLTACKKTVDEQERLYAHEFGGAEEDAETETPDAKGSEGGERQYAVRIRNKTKIADMRGTVLRRLSETQRASGMKVIVNPGRIRDPELASLFEGRKAVMTERDRMIAKLALQWVENAQLDDPFVLENPNKVEEEANDDD